AGPVAPRPGRSSPTRPTGTTTCSEVSTTCARPAPSRTGGWPSRSTWSSPSAVLTAAGHSRIPIPAGCTSRWTRARGDRAGGTPSGPCACSGGTGDGGLTDPADVAVGGPLDGRRSIAIDHAVPPAAIDAIEAKGRDGRDDLPDHRR